MKKQKEIGKAIKLARSIGGWFNLCWPIIMFIFPFAGFMPYTYKPFDYLEDPKLFR